MTTSLRSVPEHRSHVLDHVRLTESIEVGLGEAEGKTLRDDATARLSVPPFTNSSMDGFAVRFEDVASASEQSPATLDVIADLPAGVDLDPDLAPGQAIRIMTGAPLPQASDTIVPFEHTLGGLEDSLAQISVLQAPSQRGAFVRSEGENVTPGDLVLTAGTLIGARQIASLAATGIAHVTVAHRPRLVVLSTGTELVTPGEPLKRGQIPDTNGALLAGLGRSAGAEVIGVHAIPDDADSLREHLATAIRDGADAVCFSGGVSAGAYEVVREVLGASGQMEFGHVTMQPGKPQGFGVTEDGCLLFGLPGNPVSSAVSFEVFVRPAILAMQGRAEIHRPRRALRAATAWDSPAGREQYVPVVIDDTDPRDWTVTPASARGSQSHLIGTLGLAEALAIVSTDRTHVAVGDMVEVVDLP